jgi:hypothetical protein
MKKITFLLLTLATVFIISCNKDKYEAPKAKTVAMAGRWWVELYSDDDQNGVIDVTDNLYFTYSDFGQYGIITSNTGANGTDSMIVTDSHLASTDRWPFKFKAPIDLGSLKFNPSTNLNIESGYIGSGETVKIIEGKILKGAAHNKSGAIADSIFLEFEFSDDAGTYYIYSGHRDSGQPEDQY